MTESLSQALSLLDILLAELDPDERLEAVIDMFRNAIRAGEDPDQRLLDELAEALDSGKLVYYRRSDLDEWINSRTVRVAG